MTPSLPEAGATLARLGRSLSRLLATAAMLGTALPATALAQQATASPSPALAGAANQPANLPLPKIETHAPTGFRLYRPGYRLSGKGAVVSAQLCRLPGWAAAGPQYLRIERLDPAGQPGESHQRSVPRLGMRVGNNCAGVSLPLLMVPTYGETIKLCAGSGRGGCP